MKNRRLRTCARFVATTAAGFVLLGCAGFGAQQARPSTTPAPLASYNAAIATAQAGGDPKVQALAFYERGNANLDQGNNQAAVADYTQSIKLDATNARAFNNRALAYAALGQANPALADYAVAIKLDPAYTRAYLNRLHLLEQRGDLKAIAANYGRLAQLDPKNAADYRYRQGSALHGLRDFAGARQAYNAALAANPQHVDALYERALLSFAEGQPASAITDLDRAIKLSPRAANAYYARGQARAALADQAAAIADFTQALALQPEYPEALLARALAYHATSRDDLARADMATLAPLTLDPTLQSAADALQRELPGQ
jgi:tetratricopeptide (TPR) repeat protein